MGYKCASKEKKRKEKNKINQSKIEEKQKKIEKKERKEKRGSLDQTMSEQCAELPKAKKKEKVTMTWLKPEGCVKQSPA